MPEKDQVEEAESKQQTHSEAPISPVPIVPQTGIVTGHNKRSFWSFFRTKKGKITLGVIAAVIIIVSILLVVPTTRYGMLGPFIHKDLSVTVIDSKTGKPVSDATVSVASVTTHTDSNGKATLPKLSVGIYTVTVTKKNYKGASQSALVSILHDPSVGALKLEATGRQVPINVTNKITGAALAKATIVANDATAITDDKGEATLVLPANDATVAATIKADTYNTASISVTVTEQNDPKNIFTLTPAGKIYFLSKRTGIINVMKSDLDGGNQQVVVQGTGKEDDRGTVLLASRDWKYLLLQAKRGSAQQGLYVINTANDQLAEIDTGNASFTSIGWHNHTFAYQVYRLDVPYDQPKRAALKSYDAEANKLVTLDETSSQGGKTNEFDYPYFDDSKGTIVYVANVQSNSAQTTFNSVQLDGSNKKVLYSLPANAFVSFGITYAPNEFYYIGATDPKNTYYVYEDGAVKPNTNLSDNQITQQFYPTFLQSPSGNQTFWYEPRDGKNTVFIGDKDGKNAKQVAASSDFTPYGWYSDDYLLLSKNSSELYIVSARDTDFSKAIKLTDYHKPVGNFYGYGGGYGGF